MTKIKSGVFYKTRDGRRVGPTYTFGISGYLAVVIDGEDRVFDASNGHHEYGIRDLDLIAEWVDEPVASATAPFKAGDRVRFTDKVSKHYWFKEGETGVISKVCPGSYHEYEVTTDRQPYGHDAYVTRKMIELVEESAPAFKPGDRVRRPGHLTGTVLGVNANEVRIDYGADWGEYIFTVPELELVKAATPPATIKVGDWVRTDNGEIGIVLHDDGSEFMQFKVGFVGDGDHGHWDWFSDLELTIVPPGTVRAENDNSALLAEIDELEQRLSDLCAKLAA